MDRTFIYNITMLFYNQPQPFSLCSTMLTRVRLKRSNTCRHSLLHSFVKTALQASTPSPPPLVLQVHRGISAGFVMSPAAINKVNPGSVQTSPAGTRQLVTNLFGTRPETSAVFSVFCLRGLLVSLGLPLNMSSPTKPWPECPSAGPGPKRLSLYWFYCGVIWRPSLVCTKERIKNVSANCDTCSLC